MSRSIRSSMPSLVSHSAQSVAWIFECRRLTVTSSSGHPFRRAYIPLQEAGLRRVLKSYLEYSELTRTHLSLEKDAPIPRRAQLPELGTVVEFSQVGGLHLLIRTPRGLACL